MEIKNYFALGVGEAAARNVLLFVVLTVVARSDELLFDDLTFFSAFGLGAELGEAAVRRLLLFELLMVVRSFGLGEFGLILTMTPGFSFGSPALLLGTARHNRPHSNGTIKRTVGIFIRPACALVRLAAMQIAVLKTIIKAYQHQAISCDTYQLHVVFAVRGNALAAWRSIGYCVRHSLHLPMDDWDTLHYATQRGDIEAVKSFLTKGRDINAFDEISFTPLHHAAAKGHLELVKVLLEAGADVNAHEEARIGNTPLGDIAGNCSLEMARVLVAAGADPTIRGWMQLSALDRAEARKKAEGRKIYELLVEAAKRFKRSN